MPENQELIPLSMATSAIKKETGKAVPGGYTKLYSLILRGQIDGVKVGRSGDRPFSFEIKIDDAICLPY